MLTAMGQLAGSHLNGFGSNVIPGHFVRPEEDAAKLGPWFESFGLQGEAQ